MVRLAGVGRQYGDVAPVVALTDVDLEVETGERVAIVGASGSGKTTLLNIIGCLDRQSTGSYWLDGADVSDLSDSQRAGLRSRDIGFVFQASTTGPSPSQPSCPAASASGSRSPGH
jgi:ABC-type lipoprotein export system ATPase subunit